MPHVALDSRDHADLVAEARRRARARVSRAERQRRARPRRNADRAVRVDDEPRDRTVRAGARTSCTSRSWTCSGSSSTAPPPPAPVCECASAPPPPSRSRSAPEPRRARCARRRTSRSCSRSRRTSRSCRCGPRRTSIQRARRRRRRSAWPTGSPTRPGPISFHSAGRRRPATRSISDSTTASRACWSACRSRRRWPAAPASGRRIRHCGGSAARAKGEWAEVEVMEDLTGGFNYGSGTVEVQCPPTCRIEPIAGHRLHWLRCRIAETTRVSGEPAVYTQPPEIYQITAAPVGALLGAEHSELEMAEPLGISDGSPGQTFATRFNPVLGLEPRRDAGGPDPGRRLGAMGGARLVRRLAGPRPPFRDRPRPRIGQARPFAS